ncbi:MAG: hypothetical protein K1X78_14200 [Verrucomicrobiaceae bacterium]|nr:hypothetical protein [Verrucomicrobiaceae bacterium]
MWFIWIVRILATGLGGGLAWFSVVEIRRALRTGVLRTRNGFLIPRNEQPAGFWSGVLIHVITCICGLVIFIGGIIAPWTDA